MAHRLLVIDDSLTIRKLVEISLRGRGFVVDYAATGREGIERARRDRPDLILLDFVLPDIKGIDVCKELAQDGPTATCPIIVLTGKQAQIRELFKDLRQVVDYIQKPFSPEDLAARVDRALATFHAPPSAPAIASAASSTAASFRFTLFARLHAGFLAIPEWMRELGDAEPAAFFSNRLFSEQRLAELFEALVPIFKQTLRQKSREPDEDLAGSLAFVPVRRVLDLVGESGATGELEVLQDGGERTRVFVRGGEVVLATNTDPTGYLGGILSLDRLAPAHVAQATEEQRRSGKPVPVTLATAGALPGVDVTSLVHAVSCRVLTQLLATSAGNFSWRRRPLPSYVETYARVISLAALELERLRAQAPAEQLAGAAVCARAPQFSERVRRLVLDAAETRVLALVDGVASADELAVLAGLAAEAGGRVLARLVRVGLLQIVPAQAAPLAPRPNRVTAARVSVARRQVMVLEPDERHFRAPLLRRLAAHQPGYEVITVGHENEAVATMLRDRPALVLINATAHPAVTLQSAREIAARPELSRTRLVAVLDAPEPAQAEKLTAAGCDTVLVKPVHVLEIERLLVGEPSSLELSRTDVREVR